MKLKLTLTKITMHERALKDKKRAWKGYEKPTLHLWREDKTVLSHLEERWTDKEFNLEIKRQLLPAIKAIFFLDQPLVALWWSQYAGCTCPCSPGWLIKNAGLRTGSIYGEYKVEVVDDEVQPELPKQHAPEVVTVEPDPYTLMLAMSHTR